METWYSRFSAKPKEEYTKKGQLAVTFGSGYLAGIFCAVISHPADTIVSKLYNNKAKAGETIGKQIANIYKQVGFNGLWMGLGPRIFMIGTLTGFQWWIYDSWKTVCGFQTSGCGGERCGHSDEATTPDH